MAFSLSGLYVANWIDVFDATQLAVDLSLSTAKVALYTNTLSPNFSTDSVYSSTNELPTAGGYTAGGAAIASPTNTESPTGAWMYDHADQAWTSATFSGVRGCIEYVAAASKLVVATTFGADYAVTAGTFTIQYAATGVFAVDLTP